MFVGDGLANVMEANVNVFCSGVIVVVHCELKGGLVVTIHRSGDADEMSKDVADESPEPHAFFCGMRGGYVFGFGCRKGDEFLLA